MIRSLHAEFQDQIATLCDEKDNILVTEATVLTDTMRGRFDNVK